MRVIYISPRDLRKNRSDAVHMMHTCASMSYLGHDVTIITPKVIRSDYKIEENQIFKLYGLQANFKIMELPFAIQDSESFSLMSALKKFIFYGLFYLDNISLFRKTDTIVYSKCFISSLPYIILKYFHVTTSQIIFEGAVIYNKILHKIIYRRCDKIVVGLSTAKAEIVRIAKISTSKMSPDNFAPIKPFFLPNISNKLELRDELELVKDTIYVLYAGKTSIGYKNLEYFFEAAKYHPNLIFMVVGCNHSVLEYYQVVETTHRNIILKPFVDYVTYYKYVKSADILVDYYPNNHFNENFLGPGKSGTYLLSGNPVIFSDLKSLRSRFTDEIVFFVAPDDPAKLSLKIQEVLDNPSTVRSKIKKAASFIEENSFINFYQEVMEFIKVK